jgi:transposase
LRIEWTVDDANKASIPQANRAGSVPCFFQETEGKAKGYFRDWYERVIRTKMAPMKKLARSFQEPIDRIVTYCTHGITAAVADGINSEIISIKRRAGGYRNIENFKIAVLFHCGGLDLDPRKCRMDHKF